MLVPNIIEVKTPPPPMYEEEMEEQKKLEAQPKYNKDFYASSSDSGLSSIASEDEGDNEHVKSGDKAAKKGKKKRHKKQAKRKASKEKEEGGNIKI